MVSPLAERSVMNVLSQAQAIAGDAYIQPIIREDGRIMVPGFSAGLSLSAYLNLIQLYANSMEATRTLAGFQTQLRLEESTNEGPITPLQASTEQAGLFYKREDLTATRAYKVRGAMVAMAKAKARFNAKHFLAVSTGNHAMGVLHASQLLGAEAVTIVVPHNTDSGKLSRIDAKMAMVRQAGVEACLVKQGDTFDAARLWAIQNQGEATYIDPYNDPWVVAGQGTIGVELYHQLCTLLDANPDVSDVVVVAPVGGGGLLSGLATTLKMSAAWDLQFRAVNFRFVGLRLESFDTVLGDAVRVKEIASDNRMRLASLGVSFMLMDDAMMQAGQDWVFQDIQAQTEGPSAATVFPVLYQSDIAPSRNRLVISILSGGYLEE